MYPIIHIFLSTSTMLLINLEHILEHACLMYVIRLLFKWHLLNIMLRSRDMKRRSRLMGWRLVALLLWGFGLLLLRCGLVLFRLRKNKPRSWSKRMKENVHPLTHSWSSRSCSRYSKWSQISNCSYSTKATNNYSNKPKK